MTIKEIQKEIVNEFEEITEWDEKYGLLIKFGRELNEFPDEFRNDKNKIAGCQSQVWLNASFKDGKIYLDADSDSTIVKGLAALLLNVYSEQTPSDILSSPPDFLHKIGIDSHLSPTRKNGLGAMLKQIQLYAVAFNALSKGTK
jgi:cysteine desulfuration protein SufE